MTGFLGSDTLRSPWLKRRQRGSKKVVHLLQRLLPEARRPRCNPRARPSQGLERGAQSEPGGEVEQPLKRSGKLTKVSSII